MKRSPLVRRRPLAKTGFILRATPKRRRMKRDTLDALFSKFIRTRDKWTCQRCGKVYLPPTQALHCAHVLSRGKLSVRYDVFNAAALCYGCHRWLDTHPDLKTAFFLARLGQTEYDLLQFRAAQPGKIERELVKAALLAKLADVEG
jgi:hypothetical protein